MKRNGWLRVALVWLAILGLAWGLPVRADEGAGHGASQSVGQAATPAEPSLGAAAAVSAGQPGESSGPGGLSDQDRDALFTLGVGMVTVLGLIIVLRINAFIALITAAIVVSLLAPGPWPGKIERVAAAFGSSVGSIGIVIAMAAVIGKCMLDSGAADRVVRAFLRLMGEKRSPVALMGSGFVLAVPVFFDTVFYLLVPLARSLYSSTRRSYLKYLLAICAGGAITHTLVPPTPGPLMMASNLGFDVGLMILVGGVIALPAAAAGLVFAGIADRLWTVPMRQVGSEPDPEPLDDSQLPSLWLALLPVVLPVVLISTNTVLTTIADGEHAALLEVEDVRDWPALRATIRQQAAEPSSPGRRIMDVLQEHEARAASAAADAAGPAAQQKAARLAELIELIHQQDELSDAQRRLLIDGLNDFILGKKDFYEEQAFLGARLNDVARQLKSEDRLKMKKVDAERLNRALLESALVVDGAEGARSLIAEHEWETPARRRANASSLIGNANLALLLSTVIAMLVLVRQRQLTRGELAKVVELSLMSGGVIILITAGGGAFGAMLNQAKVGDAIRNLFQIEAGSGAGMMFLVLGFAIAAVLKIAQGSSTVAMITASAMLAGIAQPETLGFHPVYLATAIGAGSLVGSWMNDSGFWIFAKMGGLTEVETLKSWSLLLVVLACSSFAATLLLVTLVPLV